jgi:outer membrane protein TolC
LDTLRILLGLSDGAAIELSDSLRDLGAAEVATPAVEAPVLRRLGWLARAVEHEKSSVSRSFLPTIDLFGKVDYQYPKTFFEDDEAGLVYAFGVALSWDVFDGDLRRRKKAELDARSAELRDLRRAAEEDMQRKVTEADSHARSAAAREQAAKKSVDSAQVYLVAAQAALAAGTGTALDVRRAEEAVDKARLGMVRAHFETALASAQKLHARGATYATADKEMNR